MTAIYLAGKVAKNDWRNSVVTPYGPGYHWQGYDALLDSTWDGVWPVRANAVVDYYTFTGPYPTSCDHGCAHTGTHGVFGGCIESGSHTSRDEARTLIRNACRTGVERADIVYAYIESADAYGTLVELGWAESLQKQVWIHFAPNITDEQFDDLWFAAGIGNARIASSELTPATFLKGMAADEMALANKLESPLEELFWQTYQQLRPAPLIGLVPQHHTGLYRLDLAIPEIKFAIELDGYAYHSSKERFTQDRARQRSLELEGWRIARFSGEEVFKDPNKCVAQAAALADVRRRSGAAR